MEVRITPADWQRLRVLRDRFLTDASEEYWTQRDLELYDGTFAQRIRWKWDGVFESLDRARWKPASTRILDWGCGTGIAARAVAEWSGIRTVEFFDQSPRAAEFAAHVARHSGLDARMIPAPPDPLPPGTLLVLSHVAGELNDEELARVAGLAATAREIIWVEPGSREISRRLSGVRGILLGGGLRFLAPCTHQHACPMLEPAHERHWCHFFADPPPPIFQSAFWREVSTRIQIDLRALPYSFLAADASFRPDFPEEAERLIGRPVELKGHARLLCCGTDGLNARTLQKRDEPELFRRITKKGLDGVFAWQLDPEKRDRIQCGRCVDEI